MRRISKNTKNRYDWAIKYIKDECSGGRHITASLGSAGYTFVEDIEALTEYASSQGDYQFIKLLTEGKNEKL